MLLGLILFLGNLPAFGQEKINFSAGFGLPDLLNVGVCYQLNQSQIEGQYKKSTPPRRKRRW